MPREVICFALRQIVSEYLEVMSLYKVVKLLSQLKGQVFIFCESWCSSRVCFEFTFIYCGNGRSVRRHKERFIDGVVAYTQSCFLLGIIE